MACTRGFGASAVQWRGPCIQAAQTRIKPRQKYGDSRNRPRLGVHQVGEGSAPQAVWQQSGEGSVGFQAQRLLTFRKRILAGRIVPRFIRNP